MTDSSPSSRIYWLDLLKWLATLAVIVIHVSVPGIYQAPAGASSAISLTASCLAGWAIPVFVMVSGALFLNPAKEITLRSLYTRYVPRILLAYLFWWVVYAVVRLSVHPVDSGESIWTTKYLYPHFHLWFLPMLAAVYALIPLLRKIASDEGSMRYFLLIWSIYVGIGFFGISALQQLSSLFLLNKVIGYSGYFVLGYWLSRHPFTQRQRRLIYLAGIIGLAITLTGSLMLCAKGAEHRTFFMKDLSLQLIATSMAVFLLVKEIGASRQAGPRSLVARCRKDLFGIYLTHALWLFFLTDTVRDTVHPLLLIPLGAISIYILSFLTTRLLRMIPLIRRFVE